MGAAVRTNEDVRLGKVVICQFRRTVVNPTYVFQLSVYNSVVMQIIETTGDPDQLQCGKHGIMSPVP